MVATDYTFTTTTSIDQLVQTARSLIDYGKDCPIWLFNGEMGAGKTTLIRVICKELGILTPVSSPTFTLIHTYYLPNGDPIYHLDAYRIDNEKDMLAMDYPFYFDSGVYSLIEWPQKIQSIIPIPHILINLFVHPKSHTRHIDAHFIESN